ncbi:hypothetical protein EV207_12220 [Scopulibacillus darangshiensis]|uniref:Uncharacterized protein n=1 Tax=Scopulibacillus darangshiensis TaxID=442528 RepID=A0A4R2NSU5_9BACL|nr:hypothetical protein EV207_12220 [Scopulibacillus darangshiensis]
MGSGCVDFHLIGCLKRIFDTVKIRYINYSSIREEKVFINSSDLRGSESGRYYGGQPNSANQSIWKVKVNGGAMFG